MEKESSNIEEENKEKALSLLNRLKSFFGFTKKEILAIKVRKGSEVFWCTNPKKIKFWRSVAQTQALYSFNRATPCVVEITKVIYK
jgi:hypothetical protein